MTKDLLLEISREHFRAVSLKNIESIIAAYQITPDLLVFVEGPRWATHGFENVAKGWRDFVASDIMGFVAGIVELKARIKGELKTIRFRGTFVFAAKDGAWKIVHEHFSQPAEDPYGIGDWLK